MNIIHLLAVRLAQICDTRRRMIGAEMPRVCRVCTHTERNPIDLAIATRNGSIRSIAVQYGLSKTSLSRHAADHLAPSAKRTAEYQDAETMAGISSELRQI